MDSDATFKTFSIQKTKRSIIADIYNIIVTQKWQHCDCFSIRGGTCLSEIDVMIRIECRNIENDWNIRGEDVSVRDTWASGLYAIISYTPVRGGKIICKREKQRDRLCETNRDTSLPASFVSFFFCVRFLFSEGQSVQSASFVRVPIHMSDTYVWETKKLRVGEEGINA